MNDLPSKTIISYKVTPDSSSINVPTMTKLNELLRNLDNSFHPYHINVVRLVGDDYEQSVSFHYITKETSMGLCSVGDFEYEYTGGPSDGMEGCTNGTNVVSMIRSFVGVSGGARKDTRKATRKNRKTSRKATRKTTRKDTRKDTRKATRKDTRKDTRKASRKNRKDTRKNRKASRKNRKASRKNRKASRKNRKASRKNRK